MTASAAANPRFPLFDSLRAIAALTIFAYHVAFIFDRFGGLDISPWLRQLNVGVPIFFVISGFLLYRPFARARLLGTSPPGYGGYAIRRALRIIPAYWVALVLIALWLGEDDVFTIKGVFTYFGFLQMYDPQTFTGGIGQAWTLDVEVLFYLTLPLWAMLIARGGRGLAPNRFIRDELLGLGGLFLFGLAYKLVVVETALADDSPDAFVLLTILPAWFDTFAVGMAIAAVSVWAAEGGGRSAAVRLVENRPWIPWTIAAAAFLLLGALRLGERPMVIAEHELKAFIAAGIVLPAVFGDPTKGVVRRILGFPPLLWIGLVSYAVYLWHLAVLQKSEAAFRADLGDVAVVVIALAGTLAIAGLSWYVLERPILRWGRRLTGPTAQTRTLADDERAIAEKRGD